MILNDWRLTGKTSSRYFFLKGKGKKTKRNQQIFETIAREGRRKRNLFCFWIVFIPVSFFKILLVFMLFSFKINHIGNDSYSEYYHANYSYLEYSRANYSYLEYSYEYIGTHAKKHNSCTFFFLPVMRFSLLSFQTLSSICVQVLFIPIFLWLDAILVPLVM